MKKRLLGVVCLIFAAGTAAAQNGSVTFSSDRLTVKEAMKEISGQSGYLFAINHTTFDSSRQIDFVKRGNTIAEALSKLLEGTGCTYEVSGQHILIIPKPVKPIQPAAVKPAAPVIIPSAPPVAEPTQEVTTTTRIIRTESFDIPIDTTYRYAAQTRTVTTTGIPALRSDRFNADTPSLVSLKLNLLYGAAALTPNLAVEFGLGKKTSLDLTGSYNPWNLDGSEEDNKKLVHWIVRPEFRYWLCERSNGHFFGAHAFYWQYNVAQTKVPLLFDKGFRYEGNAFGLGLSYGYHLMLGRHWGLEFNVGAGLAFMKYDKYDCEKCGDKLGSFKKTYYGPTSAGIKLVYIIK